MALDLRVELEAAQQAYLDNADYAEAFSVIKAKAFITACRKLLLLLPQMTRQASRFELQIDTKLIPAALKDAEQFVIANPDVSLTGGGVRGFSLRDFGY